ncbi:MAG TPA: outer membrane protein assembly factor BamB [Rhodocyclaceae bacterium]
MAVAVALLASGCASEPSRKPLELPEITAETSIRVVWQVPGGDLGHAALRPAANADAVFIAAPDGRLGRYRAGEPVWEIATKLPISGGVSTDGEIVVVGTSKGEVVAFATNDGSERWRARVSSEVLAPPVFAGDRILVRSGDHRLFALDARDGTRQWVMQRTTPALTLRVTTPPVFAENFAFLGYPGGKLLAVGVANGAVLWEGSVALSKGTTELERIADIAGSPVLGPREVCAAAYQGRVACFDLSSGNLIWAQEVSADSSIALDSSNIYVADTDGVVHAYARADGKLVWQQDALKWRRLGAPLVRRGFLLVGDGSGVLHALRLSDGALVGRLASDGGGFSSDPVIAGDTTIYQTRRGGVLAVELD